MGKRVSLATAFNPTTGVVDASGIAGFVPGLVLAIVNTTVGRRATMADFLTEGLGISSISGSQMTLEYDTSAMSESDNVMIIWDDGQSAQSAVSPLAIAAGLALLTSNQLQPLAQAALGSMVDVGLGGSTPATGTLFVNSDGFVVKAR